MQSKGQKGAILVTGASTGLGLAIARRLLLREDNLVLTARRSSLARFAEEGIAASDRVLIAPLDVTNGDQRRGVMSLARQRFGAVDVLINNAGVSYRSVVEHVTESERLAQLDVNFHAPMELIRLALPPMRRRGVGHIINISSVSGMMAMPTMGAYCASKFALEGATEALYYEVKPWNVRVTLVQPGFIHSSSFENVRTTRQSDWSIHHLDDDYHAHYEHMSPFIEKLMGLARATPEAVAKKVVRLLDKRRPPLRVAGTIDAYLFSLLRRVLPRGAYHYLLYRSLPRIKRWGLPAGSGTSKNAALPPKED